MHFSKSMIIIKNVLAYTLLHCKNLMFFLAQRSCLFSTNFKAKANELLREA